MRYVAIAVVIVCVAVMALAARWLWQMHRAFLDSKARWVDHHYVGASGAHIVCVQKVAHTRWSRHVLDEQFVAMISPVDVMWGLKLRKARAEAYDRAIDLNNPPLMEG